MLTPPKWQTVWLKSQYSSRNISKKIMFSKPADKILDDLSKCCNSASKELALEALNCWMIWIENQQVEDWKENETCYSAVRPLLTKKFHPLHRDGEVSEKKLSLLWLALQKTQGLMHLEGPQHILEVFIQSCLSWLSCSDDVDCNIRDLILKLLRSLFISNVDLQQENKFPPLSNDIWKSNKLFCRLLTLFLEIFHNWTKIKEKTDLLCIWYHFLDHCELSFKFIPVVVWHKIFKLVESICSDDKELLINKVSLLHKCATCLKSVLSNSKFIDCSQVLTTPAEALLKIIVELSVNNKDENISFETFQYCLDICHILSGRIIHTFGYDSCIYTLSKIEEIESKPLLWALWCGLANCFRDQVNDVNRENYSNMELKMYRKLRSVAANFDLDRITLDERALVLIQPQRNFLCVPIICENCSTANEKTMEGEATPQMSTENPSPTHDESVQYAGDFGFDVNSVSSKSCSSSHENPTDTLMEVDETENPPIQSGNCRSCRVEKGKTPSYYEHKWMKRYCGSSNLTPFKYFCDNIQNERLITFKSENRRGMLLAPICLTVLLDELCNVARKSGESSTTDNFVEKVKKVQNKVKEGTIVAPTKLFLSIEGSSGVEFYSNAVAYWNDVDEIANDVDLMKNLNFLKTKNDRSVVLLSMFLFLVNFTKNLFFENNDSHVTELRKLDPEEETALTVGLINFMRKVTNYKTRLSNVAFLANMSKVLPTKSDNPLMMWTNCVSARNSKVNSASMHCRTSNENLMNIFKYFDELESKDSNQVKRRKKNVRRRNETGRSSPRLRRRSSESGVKIMENESVTVVQAPPDVFRTMTFSEWRSESDTPKKSKNRTSACEKRRRQSPDNKVDAIQDENVNIENRSKKRRKSDDPAATLSPRAVYSLRQRPLQRPSKFKDTKCLFPDDFNRRKCSDRKFENELSSSDCTSHETKVLTTSEDDVVTVNNDLVLSNVKDCDFDTKEETVLAVEAEVEDGISKADTENCDDEISDLINNIIDKVEEESTKTCEVGVESREEVEPDDSASKINKAVKRQWKFVEESPGGKRLKTDADDSHQEREEVAEDESTTVAPKVTQKPDAVVIQSRGSRMLALVPESPRLNGFHDSSPSSKHQAMKPPNVLKNSRASKMLALLPELQDVGAESVSVKETIAEKSISEDDNNTRRTFSGFAVGIIHHLTPSRNGSAMSAESPKRSPLRQRRSIRFDDDRNETVRYFTDSPPCQTIKQGMRFRGCDK